VAVKVLLTATSREPIARRRFLQEAQSASALNHPNIVTVHAIEETDDLDFMVMEFVEGQNLKNLIHADGALPLTRLLKQTVSLLGAVKLNAEW